MNSLFLYNIAWKYFFTTLHENTLARDVILVAGQRISNVVSRSFPLFTLLQKQPRWCHVPEYFYAMF